MNLYFYTKKGCPLCDKGLIVLENLQKKYPFQITERDIYDKDEWLEAYQIRIPVIEDENGEVLEEGIITSTMVDQKISENFKG